MADGFEAMSVADATKNSGCAADRVGRSVQPSVYKRDIGPNLRAGQTLCFCHGCSAFWYGQIQPPKDVNVVLYVPNAPGLLFGSKYKNGEGVYGCVSVDHDATGTAKQIVLAISKAVGSTRAGVVEMTFQHETEGDNFEEQILYGRRDPSDAGLFQCDGGKTATSRPGFAYGRKAIRSLRSVIRCDGRTKESRNI